MAIFLYLYRIYSNISMSTDKSNDNNLPSYSPSMTQTIETLEERSVKSESASLNTLQELSKKAESEIDPKFKPFYSLNLLEMVIELKNTWFGILDDILAGNFTLDVIIKDNRLFYVGFTILIIAIILYIYDYAIDSKDPLQNLLSGGSNGVVEIRHIYESK